MPEYTSMGNLLKDLEGRLETISQKSLDSAGMDAGNEKAPDLVLKRLSFGMEGASPDEGHAVLLAGSGNEYASLVKRIFGLCGP